MVWKPSDSVVFLTGYLYRPGSDDERYGKTRRAELNLVIECAKCSDA
jgi:hypothetical protein